MSPVKIKLGIPKGSLQESTIKMFDKAGFKISVSERSYFPAIDDEEIELIMLRAQEISKYVEAGALDCGITGGDWIAENGSDVKERPMSNSAGALPKQRSERGSWTQ